MITSKQRANAIRALSMDAVQQANSGHPGMPLGMADIAEVLWHQFLRHNPKNPQWFNRDRFVLSNGHGSMLLYSLLHLTGYNLSLQELKNFRQWGSKTPGHPENHLTPGVETTTGPLGQGIANAVGMALAEKLLAQYFNQPQFSIIDHYTYCFLGDGCLMEGISHEVCSLAGTWKLGKLIVFWDNNGISIDGEIAPWFNVDVAKQFEAYGWHVIRDVDGHYSEAMKQAIMTAQSVNNKPTLICCKTIIGFGSPNVAGSADCHGSALGEQEIALTREHLGWSYPAFEIPTEIYESWSAAVAGEKHEAQWNASFAEYQKKYPEKAAEFERRIHNKLPTDWKNFIAELLVKFSVEGKTDATRKSSLNCLEKIAPHLPELLGGSADLTGSNCTKWKAATSLMPDNFLANYIHYGVREFGMSAIMNGVVLHGGFKVFGGTFLTFSDYARNAVRMASLMKLPVTFVYSHESIGLGEDGPTHQPVEHTASLRLIPNLRVWRPCDDVETLVAWQAALESKQNPHALLLTRQNLVHQTRNEEMLENIKRGGYILKDCVGIPEILIIATGSEVELAMQAAQQLSNKAIRVISMPCVELFLQQNKSYQDSVLPPKLEKRLAIEAGSTSGWYQFVGCRGKVIGLDHFGESAPANILFKEFGFTVENVIKQIETLENIDDYESCN